uniref:Ion_trans domain-containing protein n=2 Tax=Mesocestoides corti TaxID=53468 RepID=A0A5K3F7S5_MESCO
MYKEDSLKYSLWRINTYRALASPAWISLTSPDPVLAAFKLSWELSNLASRENEFKEVFIQLSDQCKKYACDLLDQCRSTEEVLAVLSRTSDDQSDERSKEYDESTNQKGRTALCRTTTVTQKYKRRWYRPSPQADNSFELEDLEDCDGLTRLEHHKRLESQYTIMEDLASLTNHQEQGYHIGEKGQSERMNEKMKNKEYMESDMDEVSDEEQYDESGEDCFDESESEDVPAQLRLDRLKLAIKYDQKRFVAHPHCQHILTTLWYDQLPGWRKRHPILKLLLCFGFVLALPFLAIIYLFYPRGSVARVLRSPLIKFVNHSASIAIFLILLLIASTDGESVKSLEVRQLTRGPDPNLIELLIAWWVFGFVWSEMKQIWEEGFKAYVRQWWNWLDFIMLTLFLTTVGLRVVGLILRKTGRYGFDPTSREHWPSNDPTLLSEAFFAIAHIFSFARIIFLFQVNEQLGPLQISLGNMLIDITKFLFIFLLVITSFACGLHQLYYYYISEDNDLRPAAFSSLLRSYQALFWHLFGVTQINQYRIQTKDAEGNLIDLKSAQVTMTVGEILLMIYHAMAIIVLVNMLIAMMSNSFQTIQNQADIEWKFARSKLWLGYFDEGSTLPPPLNTIISPKSIWRFSKGIFHFLTCSASRVSSTESDALTCIRQHPQAQGKTSAGRGVWARNSVEPSIRISSSNPDNKPGRIQRTEAEDISSKMDTHAMSKQRSKNANTYQAITRILVRRYIHVSKKTMRQGVVNEDDLLEIKQDISSLRYELREDQHRGAIRSSSYMESLKRQILSVLMPHCRAEYDLVDKTQSPCVDMVGSNEPSTSGQISLQPVKTPPRLKEPGEAVSTPSLRSLRDQIQSLCEEVRRIPASSGSPTTQSTSELQGLKNEIITEVKGELHSFAKQLMQFMNQCHVSGPPSEHTSDGESFLAHRGAATGATVFTTPLSRGTEIDRERIGGVSMTCSPASGLSLAAPRHPNSRA